ncbi:hypothetical protein [Amphritea sp. HPY]|uniref:hypothetical protein n=1 Tax=Amphritea sp. HPY TaxID=3421652 RepID=UPI003D7CBF96
MDRFYKVLVLAGFCLCCTTIAYSSAGLDSVAYKQWQQWRQTTVLPEWRDTYEILLEQEMLAAQQFSTGFQVSYS